MNTEDLFKYGVTPKEGVFAGKRFIVDKINKEIVFCHNAGDKTHEEEFTHGSYDLWREPKTLFNDHTIPATWGNLKKAVEAAGLGDETEFAVPALFGGFREAEIKTDELQSRDGGKKRIYIIVE